MTTVLSSFTISMVYEHIAGSATRSEGFRRTVFSCAGVFSRCPLATCLRTARRRRGTINGRARAELAGGIQLWSGNRRVHLNTPVTGVKRNQNQPPDETGAVEVTLGQSP